MRPLRGALAANGLALGLTLYPAHTTRAVGTCVSQNRVPGGPYRGYGGAEVLFAVEAQMDELASTLNLDPVELRVANALRAGDPAPVHGWPVSADVHACLRLGQRALPASPGPDSDRFCRGWGVAALLNISGLTGILGIDRAQVTCAIARGRVRVSTACPDIGQGVHAVLARVTAEELGVPEDLVDVECDPRLTDLGTVASRGAFVTAGAAALAARALGETITVGSELGPELDGLSETVTFEASDNGLVAGAQFVQVEVDCETGRVQPLRIVSVHDAGRVLDPRRAAGQVRGGVVHGLGMALTERLCFDERGAAVDDSLLAQSLPPADWGVAVEPLFVEGHHAASPLGAKGLGESPVMAVIPAVANAIHAATGARLREAPFTPERVLAALEAREPLPERRTVEVV